MKIAYLLLVHDQPNLTAQLVNAIASPDSSVYIHVDAKSNEDAFRLALASSSFQKNIHFIKNRVPCAWGRYSLVKATLHLLREAFDEGTNVFDYFILLSGRDFPIKSNSDIMTFLEKQKGVDYIEHFALPSEKTNEKQGGLYRINRYHYLKKGTPQEFPPYSKKPILHSLFNTFAKFYQLTFRRMPLGMKAYIGSQWWMLSNKTVKNLLEFLQANPSIEGFFKNVWIPDEIFFQTIISHLKCEKHLVYNNNYRLIISWAKSQQNSSILTPKILTIDDFSSLMTSDALFARKFDEQISAELLIKIKTQIL